MNLAAQVIIKFRFSEPSSSGSQKHKTLNSLGGSSTSVGGGPPNGGSGKRLGRPPKKGTHLPFNSLGGTSLTSPRQSTSSQHGGGTSAGETSAGRKRSPASSPEREEGDESQAKRSKKKSNKRSVHCWKSLLKLTINLDINLLMFIRVSPNCKWDFFCRLTKRRRRGCRW